MNSDRFHRMHELFDAASELSSSDQANYLQQACGDDKELRREVESLLAFQNSGDSLLDKGPHSWPQELPEGATVGPYRALRQIGRGGMGIVYLAEDTRLHRQVALKALAPGLRANERQQVRFRREAEMAAAVSHPGIATIYALEEWDNDQYIVAEYVPGSTLAEEFAEGPLSSDTVLDIGIQLSAAIAAAHDKGVIHRDLKPHNIIRGLDGKLKVLDFGLAVALEREGGDHTRLTEAGSLLGTPGYMAPEQLRGEPLDGRSDLFALGVILFEAATGEHPFVGKTLPTTMAAILASEPRGLELLRANAALLEQPIRRCLQKDPAERYLSGHELNAALMQLQQTGSPTTSGMDAVQEERGLNRRWWVFHQAAIIVTCGLLVAALWQVSVWVPDAITRAMFIGGLAIASVIVTLRIHLLVTSRHNSAAITRELSTAMPWARRADWAFSLTVVVAALDVSGELRLASALLLGVAFAYVAVFLFTEPATRSAVFPDGESKQ